MQVHWIAGRPGERGGEAVTVPLRPVAAPFVAVAQAGARVRARLRLAPEDEAVLRAVGGHLGSLAGRDLAARCTDGRMDARAKAASRATRKKALTAESSSRWAGAITRTNEDQHQLAEQNLRAERASLRARIGRIQARLAVPAAGRSGRVRGYATPAERHAKAIRLRGLQARLTRAERRLEAGAVSVVRGGKALLRTRNNLAATGLTEAAWRLEWEAARLFLTADGEKDKAWGNETIRWHPGQGWLEIKLPTPLAHLANRPHGPAGTRPAAAGTWMRPGRPRPSPRCRWRNCGSIPWWRWMSTMATSPPPSSRPTATSSASRSPFPWTWPDGPQPPATGGCAPPSPPSSPSPEKTALAPS